MLIQLQSFLRLIRWFHELLAILPFTGLYLLIANDAKAKNVSCDLSGLQFVLLCFCVQLLIAAGCVLNDIMDRDIDKINKPRTHIVGNRISLPAAWGIFWVLTVLIVLLSVYISIYMFAAWAFISTGVFILSVLYDVYFKRSPLLGNILMALLTAFIPLVLFFYAHDCIVLLHNKRIELLIWLYAAFPFLIIIPRELSLDISDLEGDKACGCRTLPVVIGLKKSRVVVLAFLVLTMLLALAAAYLWPYLALWMILIVLLLGVYIYKFRTAVTRIDYIRIGRFLWFIMIFGLIGFTIATVC